MLLRRHRQQFAEVLKYLYLTFDDPNHISLDQCKYLRLVSSWLNVVHILLGVFNTECHPLKAAAAKNFTVGTQKPSQKPFAVVSGNLPAISPQSSLKNLPLPTLNNILHI